MSVSLYFQIYETELFSLTIAGNETAITHILFGKKTDFFGIRQETELIKEAYRQITEYLAGRLKSFDLPLAPQGTEFQKRIWNVLTSIPYGHTLSYGEVAALAGSPKACRAVGMASHNNPIVLVIPCHRVIGKNGSLTGFGGGLDVKEKLLKLEGLL